MRKAHHIIGIDEAGRGPLAGPVAVGVVLIPPDFDWKTLPGVADSKTVSEKNREALYTRAKELQISGVLDFRVSLVGNRIIDRIGITAAVRIGIVRALKRLTPHDPRRTHVLLDGLLHAPLEYPYQETIIHGDAKELSIGLASIVAKVTRDRYMRRVSHTYRPYGFHIHKGYGTKTHREAIRTHGLSSLHRKSFCTNIR